MRTAARAIIVKDDSLLVMNRNKFGQQYYALIGGGVDPGETNEDALYREIKEETGVTVSNHRLVIIEDAGSMYGMQYIFLCEYISGEPALDPEATETLINAEGKNLYQPQWLSLQDLESANLLPKQLKEVVIAGLRDGFPTEPIQLTITD